jgi:hypothetical protein
MHKTSAMTAGVILAALIYVSSLGPAWRLACKGVMSQNALAFVYSPVEIICDYNEPFRTILVRYCDWWCPGIYDIH